MTDRLLDAEQPEQPTGLHEGKTVLVNESLRGLTGVFVKQIHVEGLPLRWRVTVTDPGGSGYKVGAPVSDWARNWRKAE